MDSSNLSNLLEGWTPPERLDRSWPRPVRLSGRGIVLFVVTGLIAAGGLVEAAFLAHESGHDAVPAWLPFVVGFFSVAATLVLPFKVHRERHLLADGRPAPAVVTRLRRRRTDHGAQNIVYYEFPLTEGGTCRGHYNIRRRSMPEGSVICVLYDPDDPRRSAPYPTCLVKLVTS